MNKLMHICIFVLLEVYLQGKFFEVELLGRKANAHIVWLDTAKSSSIKIVAFSFPVSNVWQCLVPYSLAKRMYHQAFKFANLVNEN